MFGKRRNKQNNSPDMNAIENQLAKDLILPEPFPIDTLSIGIGIESPTIQAPETDIGILKSAHIEVANKDMHNVEDTITDLEYALETFKVDAENHIHYLQERIAEAKLVRASIHARLAALDDRIQMKKEPKNAKTKSIAAEHEPTA